jgi:hypothetical protein
MALARPVSLLARKQPQVPSLIRTAVPPTLTCFTFPCRRSASTSSRLGLPSQSPVRSASAACLPRVESRAAR